MIRRFCKVRTNEIKKEVSSYLPAILAVSAEEIIDAQCHA